MDKKSVFEVTIEIGASPSKYWALLSFVDQKGQKHMRDHEVEEQGTKIANTLKALIKALESLKVPCLLTIYTDLDHVISAYQNNWLQNWRQNGWVNAKGKEVGNKELWQQVADLISDHSVKFIKEGG